jgi:hypothetical protein
VLALRLVLATVVLAVLVAPAVANAADGAAGRASSEATATRIFLAHPSVQRWLSRYDRPRVPSSAERDDVTGEWRVSVFVDGVGQIASGRVTPSGDVAEALVGPQVAWPLARSAHLGGKINDTPIWLAFCLVFVLALADLRRPLSLRNLDVAMLLGFSAYLWYFIHGRVFASAVAAAVPLLYFIGRCAWVGATNRTGRSGAGVLPVWILVALLFVLVGFRLGLNHYGPQVIDVGYAGVIGADRLASGESPYGNFPVENTGTPCGVVGADGKAGEWLQANGRCEAPNPLGDTYGPVAYHAYLPGLAVFGWSGKWDFLPAVRFTHVLFDLLAIAGLAAVGWRFGRGRLAVTLALAWAANPFTQYALSTNTNDAIMPVLLIWGFWAASSPPARGALVALASWTKLAALVLVPLWLAYGGRDWRTWTRFVAAFAVATAVSFWFLLAGGDPLQELRTFVDRTFVIQAERSSPFSLWDWGDYRAQGLPDLAIVQRVGQAALVVAAVAVAFVPRTKTPLQLAALTGALLVAFQFLLTHWSGLYLGWFLPFVVLTAVAGEALGGRVPAHAASPAAVPVGTPSRLVEPATG